MRLKGHAYGHMAVLVHFTPVFVWATLNPLFADCNWSLIIIQIYISKRQSIKFRVSVFFCYIDINFICCSMSNFAAKCLRKRENCTGFLISLLQQQQSTATTYSSKRTALFAEQPKHIPIGSIRTSNFLHYPIKDWAELDQYPTNSRIFHGKKKKGVG